MAPRRPHHAARSRLRRIEYASLPPARAGDLAFILFCTPKLSTHRSPDHEVLTERARFHLRHAEWIELATPAGRVQAYVWHPAERSTRPQTVLIGHGWTAESSFMAVFAEQLRRAGFRVVAFDQPGHGKSTGERASLVDCARALIYVADALGPIDHVVAHSMGGLAALLAAEGAKPMPHALAIARYVLVSTPNRFAAVTDKFAREIGLSRAAQNAYECRLERIAHRRIATFTAESLLNETGGKALLIHARDDEEVAFSESEIIAENCANAELLAFDGLGHRNILYAPPVIRAAVGFLTKP